MPNNLLLTGLKEMGFSEAKITSSAEKLEIYIKQIQLYNSAYNLVNTSDHDEIVVRHIFDSLSAASNIETFMQNKNKETFQLADIGSGAGLPGIPLAVLFPEYKFTLVERMSKRCGFLENCILMMKLKNVTVENKEIEKIPANSFDLTVFRAFRPLSKEIMKALLHALKQDGKIIAYKAKKEKIIQEMNTISELIQNYKVYPLSVPYLNKYSNSECERNLVVASKI